MEYSEQIKEMLESMRFRPTISDNGDVHFKSQSYNYIIEVYPTEDKGAFVNVVLAPFYDLEDKEDIMAALYVCNKANLRLRFSKVYITPEMDSLAASAEFYFYNKQMLKYNLKKAIMTLGVIAPWCSHELASCRKEMT